MHIALRLRQTGAGYSHLLSALLIGAGLSFSAGQVLAADQTTLSFFSWESQQTMQPVIDAFEAANPDIKIDFSTAPPVNEYIQTLQTRLLSNTAADVFIIAAENTTALIEGGFAKDLSDYDFVKVMNQQNRDAYGSDGKAYGLSLVSWGGGILYNKDLLAQVGMEELPATWDDFLALCGKLKDAGITPYYEGVQSGNMMSLYAMLGMKFLGEGGNIDQKIFSGEDSFVNEWTGPLAEYNKLYRQGLVSTAALGLSDDQIVNEFATGKVAMMGAGPWNIGTIRGINPDINMAFMQVPVPDGGKGLAGAASPGYAINANAQQPAAAEAFLSFLATPEAVELFQKASGGITTTNNFTPDIDPVLGPIYDGIQAGHIYLPMTAWPRSQDALHTTMLAEVQQMVAGEIQPEDVAKALDEKLAENQ